MAKTGKVKWYNSAKGYGFITPDDGGKDDFVHITEIQKAGFDTLREGQAFEYEVVDNRGRECAVDLKSLK